MGQPEKVNLVELGPGRGTLMADLLRVSINSLQRLIQLVFMFYCGGLLSSNPNMLIKNCYLRYKCNLK